MVPICGKSEIRVAGKCGKLQAGTVDGPWGFGAKLGRLARMVATAAAKARLARRLEFPRDLIPAGETLNSWGAKVWGRGPDEARGLIGERTNDELRALGLDATAAKRLADFYRSQAKHGRGGATAPAREELMRSIQRQLRGR